MQSLYCTLGLFFFCIINRHGFNFFASTHPKSPKCGNMCYLLLKSSLLFCFFDNDHKRHLLITLTNRLNFLNVFLFSNILLSSYIHLQFTFWMELYWPCNLSTFWLVFSVEVTSENNSEGNMPSNTEKNNYGRVARVRTSTSRRHGGGTRSPHGTCCSLRSCLMPPQHAGHDATSKLANGKEELLQKGRKISRHFWEVFGVIFRLDDLGNIPSWKLFIPSGQHELEVILFLVTMV